MSTNHLSDNEAIKALYAAGIPPLYHRKTLSLVGIEPTWPELAVASEWAEKDARDFAALGKGIEIAFDGKPAYDFAYLLARKLQLLAIPVVAISLPLLASTIASRHTDESIERLNEWESASFLFVITAFAPDEAPYDRSRMFEMEWYLRSWMLAGRSLVLQGDGFLTDSGWWSKGFQSVFTERLALRFEGPPQGQKVFDATGKHVATAFRQPRPTPIHER